MDVVDLIRRPYVPDGLTGPPGLGFRRRAMRPCGTWAAYKRHLLAGEVPCAACAQASRDQSNGRYDPAKAAARYAAREKRARPPREVESRLFPCPVCEAPVETTRPGQKYCSNRCARRAANQAYESRRRSHLQWFHGQAFVRPAGVQGPCKSVVPLAYRYTPTGGRMAVCPGCNSRLEYDLSCPSGQMLICPVIPGERECGASIQVVAW